MLNLTTKDNPIDILEKLIDDDSLCNILELIAEICYEKSDHIMANYRDLYLSSLWLKSGKQIDKLIIKIPVP